ncbi:MAG: hypothetical protein VW268_01205 [Rhodospirillaceae bacterium]
MRLLSLAVVALVFLAGCQYATLTRYNYSEVGKIQVVKFGRVIKARH